MWAAFSDVSGVALFPSFVLSDEAATVRLGRALARVLKSGDVLGFQGDLGSGKTVLVRSLVRCALNSEHEDVPSPTFTLVQVYEAPSVHYWHFDLYRLQHPSDALELGLEDALAEGISLIEWPQRLGTWFPDSGLTVHLSLEPSGGRSVRFSGNDMWARRLGGLTL